MAGPTIIVRSARNGSLQQPSSKRSPTLAQGPCQWQRPALSQLMSASSHGYGNEDVVAVMKLTGPINAKDLQ